MRSPLPPAPRRSRRDGSTAPRTGGTRGRARRRGGRRGRRARAPRTVRPPHDAPCSRSFHSFTFTGVSLRVAGLVDEEFFLRRRFLARHRVAVRHQRRPRVRDVVDEEQLADFALVHSRHDERLRVGRPGDVRAHTRIAIDAAPPPAAAALLLLIVLLLLLLLVAAPAAAAPAAVSRAPKL